MAVAADGKVTAQPAWDRAADEAGRAIRTLAGENGLDQRYRRRLYALADVLDGGAKRGGTTGGGTANGTDPHEAEGWAELDLAAAIGPPVAAASEPRRPRLRAFVDAAPSVLVFLPIVLTWLGLAAAVHAYQSLESDATRRAAFAGRSFLELWQEGFGGRLPAPLDFGWVAMYTAGVIGTLILATIGGSWLRRQDEKAEAAALASVRGALPAALFEAQLVLNRRRLASPARFAAELSRAADRLAGLIEHTERVHGEAKRLSELNIRTSGQIATAAQQLGAAVGTLDASARDVGRATTVIADASELLRRQIADGVSNAAQRLDAASAEAAERLDNASAAAAARVRSLQETGAATLDGVTERFESSLTTVSAQVDRATTALRDTAQRHADAVDEASGRAATRIGGTYEAAVEAAAVSLASQMVQAGSELRALLDEVGEAAREHTAAAERTERSASSHTRVVEAAGLAMAETLEELRSTLREHARQLQALGDRMAAATADLRPVVIESPRGGAEHGGTGRDDAEQGHAGRGETRQDDAVQADAWHVDPGPVDTVPVDTVLTDSGPIDTVPIDTEHPDLGLPADEPSDDGRNSAAEQEPDLFVEEAG